MVKSLQNLDSSCRPSATGRYRRTLDPAQAGPAIATNPKPMGLTNPEVHALEGGTAWVGVMLFYNNFREKFIFIFRGLRFGVHYGTAVPQVPKS